MASVKTSLNAQIVIVGGGMVGSSLALLLTKQLTNCRVTLVEQHGNFQAPTSTAEWQPSFDDRSTALSMGSRQIFEAMGIWHNLQHQLEPICSIHVSDRGHYGGTCLQAADYQLDALGYVGENQFLSQVLTGQLNHSDVQYLAPAKVTHSVAKPCGYELTVVQDQNPSNQQTLFADLLLVADGAESNMRRSLSIGTQVVDYHQSALIANVALSQPLNAIAYERFTDEGPIALLPLRQSDEWHRAALVWTLPDTKAEFIHQLADAQLLERLQQAFGYRCGKLIAIGKRHLYPLKLVQAEEQVRSHLAIIGNAAHFLHPVAGQGFNLALRDCQTLVTCLKRDQHSDQPLGNLKTLNHYLATQTGDQQRTIGLTDHLVTLFSTSKAHRVMARQLGLIGLSVCPLARRSFSRLMTGML